MDQANVVRVHSGIQDYLTDMLTTNPSFLPSVAGAVERGGQLVVTGYSMGGMLSHLFMLHVGEELVRRGLPRDRVTMVTFGSPRVGDEGFKARLKLLFKDETRLMNVLYPLDTVGGSLGLFNSHFSPPIVRSSPLRFWP